MKETRRGQMVVMRGALLGALLGLSSCIGSTAGESILFQTGARGATSSGEPVTAFKTRLGWTVRLSRAHLALGPVTFFEGRSYFEQASWLSRMMVKTAYAHAVHSQIDTGTVLGEVPEQFPIDLLAKTPADLGVVFGVKGTCRSVELELHPPGDGYLGLDNGAYSALDHHAIVLEGVAEKDARQIEFFGPADNSPRGSPTHRQRHRRGRGVAQSQR
jgi:hypothetical protein